MLRFIGADNCIIFRCDGYHTPGFDKYARVIDSVFVQPFTERHERVIVWSRGKVAGSLTVDAGDGEILARKLLE